VTLLAGPAVAYNLAMVVTPALAAWTAFLLCFRLTHSFWPAFVGGYLFGFSSYVLGQLEGHLNLAAVFLVPVVALLILRALDGDLGRRGLAVRLGAALGLQFLISTEVFATLTLALVVAGAIALLLVGSRRRQILALVPATAAAYAVAAIVAAPFLYYTLTNFYRGELGPIGAFAADALNYIVPTRTALIGGDAAGSISAHFPPNEVEQTAYLGLPVLLILVLYFVHRRRAASGRFLFVSLAAAVIVSFGNALIVDGHRVVNPMPWGELPDLPALNNVYAVRLTLYVSLVAAVVVALWAGSGDDPRWLRVALPVLAVAVLVPNLGHGHWDERFPTPRFFASGEYRDCLAPGENVLALPYGYKGDSVMWQATTGFRFRLAGGAVDDRIPPAFDLPIVHALVDDAVTAKDGRQVLAFARKVGAGAILVDPSDPTPWRSILAAANPPRETGGLLLYQLSARGCANR
jgi:hypothetical protein